MLNYYDEYNSPRLTNTLTSILLAMLLIATMIKAVLIASSINSTDQFNQFLLSVLHDSDMILLLAGLLVVSNLTSLAMFGVVIRLVFIIVLALMIADVYSLSVYGYKLYYPDIHNSLGSIQALLGNHVAFFQFLAGTTVLSLICCYYRSNPEHQYPYKVLVLICSLCTILAIVTLFKTNVSFSQISSFETLLSANFKIILTILCTIFALALIGTYKLQFHYSTSFVNFSRTAISLICILSYMEIVSDDSLLEYDLDEKIVGEKHVKINTSGPPDLKTKWWYFPNVLDYNSNEGINQPWRTNAEVSNSNSDVEAGLLQEYLDHEQTNSVKNVVLVVWDSLTWKDIGFLTQENSRTPQLIQFARQSRIFVNAHANGIDATDGLVSIISGNLPIPPPRSIFDLGDTASTSLPVSEKNLVRVLSYFQYKSSYLTQIEIPRSMNRFLTEKIFFSDVESTANSTTNSVSMLFDMALAKLDNATQADKKAFIVLNTQTSNMPVEKHEQTVRDTDKALGEFIDELRTTNFFDESILLVVSNQPDLSIISHSELVKFGIKAPSLIPVFAGGNSVVPSIDARLFSQADITHSLTKLMGYSLPQTIEHNTVASISSDSTINPKLDMFNDVPRTTKGVLERSNSPTTNPRDCVGLRNRFYINSMWLVCSSSYANMPLFKGSKDDYVAKVNAALHLPHKDKIYQILLDAEDTRFVSNTHGLAASDQIIFSINLRRQSAQVSNINRIHLLLYKVEAWVDGIINFLAEKIETFLLT